MENRIGMTVHLLPTAKAIWDTHHILYSDVDSLAKVNQLSQDIACLRQGEMSVLQFTHYYIPMKQIG